MDIRLHVNEGRGSLAAGTANIKWRLFQSDWGGKMSIPDMLHGIKTGEPPHTKVSHY